MKVLFCYDGPITRYKSNEYYTIGLTDEVLSRYYSFGDSLELLIRIKDADEVVGLSKITVSPLSVVAVPEIKTLSGSIKNMGRARDIIKEAVHNADFIIIRSPSKIGQLAALEASLQNKKYMVEVVAHPFDVLWYHSWKGKFISFLESYKEKEVIRNAPYAIYVTKEFLQKDYPCNGISIGCADPIAPDNITDVLEKRMHRIDGEKDKVILGTIGSVGVKFKGQEFVIKALAKLKKKGFDNFEYQLVGGGDCQFLYNMARKLGVESQVVFVGALPHHSIPNFLQDIDIYIQPSLTEGLPRSIVEAMSMAVPCIASNCGGIPELLDSSVLYSNWGNKVKKIMKLLMAFTQDKLKQQAIRNYERSKEYSALCLDESRKSFYQMILKKFNE